MLVIFISKSQEIEMLSTLLVESDAASRRQIKELVLDMCVPLSLEAECATLAEATTLSHKLTPQVLLISASDPDISFFLEQNPFHAEVILMYESPPGWEESGWGVVREKLYKPVQPDALMQCVRRIMLRHTKSVSVMYEHYMQDIHSVTIQHLPVMRESEEIRFIPSKDIRLIVPYQKGVCIWTGKAHLFSDLSPGLYRRALRGNPVFISLSDGSLAGIRHIVHLRGCDPSWAVFDNGYSLPLADSDAFRISDKLR